MNKTTLPLRGLKSQKHIDRVLHNLEGYIAHYRVPLPQQLREATKHMIAGNLGPRNAFYYDVQNKIYWLIHNQVEYLINLEIQQEKELQQEKEKQELSPRHKPTQKLKIYSSFTSAAPHTPFLLCLLVLPFLPLSHHPPPLHATHAKAL